LFYFKSENEQKIESQPPRIANNIQKSLFIHCKKYFLCFY
jgi:hypothetical protein